ncbi:hypothetical protein EUX98_g9400, partial [Antrodiella citrinella]
MSGISSTTLQCISCRKFFKRARDLKSHLTLAHDCRWVRDLRLATAPEPTPVDFRQPQADFAPAAEIQCDGNIFMVFDDDIDDIANEIPPPPPAPTPSTTLHDATHRATVEDALDEDDNIYAETIAGAGKVISIDKDVHAAYKKLTSSKADTIHAPFRDRVDYEVAQWAIEESPTQNVFTRLLAIDGVLERLGLSYNNSRSLHQTIDTLPALAPWIKRDISLDGSSEGFDLYYRDPIESLKAIYGNPALLPYMSFAPEHQYTDISKKTQRYNEMNRGDWWWETQVKLSEDGHQDATVVPIILSSDKTELSIFSGDKTAYPLYMTIGNVDKSIRRKPTYGAQMLIGYLPTTSLDGTDLTDSAARITCARIFHKALSMIFESMKIAAKDGIFLTSGDGSIRHCFPILACYVADYPEQCLVTCTRYGQTCPKCDVKHDLLGDNFKGSLRQQVDTIRRIYTADRLGTLTDTNEYLKRYGLNHITEPFFANWPHANIHTAITPDILHQLYQGLIRHILSWLKVLIGEHELDMRFK